MFLVLRTWLYVNLPKFRTFNPSGVGDARTAALQTSNPSGVENVQTPASVRLLHP
jgi:hypothetical protein